MCSYKTVLELRPRKGSLVRIGYDPGKAMPWCVGYRGAGHYWETPREALAYAAGRGFLGAHMVAKGAAEALANAADLMKRPGV